MYMLGISIIAMLLWYFEIGPVGRMDWWWLLVPLGITAAWWTFADLTGYTKRREMEKMENRKNDRLAKQREVLGLAPRRKR